jgi:hypothetical protein
MSNISVVLPDGSDRVVEQGATVETVAASIGPSMKKKRDCRKSKW